MEDGLFRTHHSALWKLVQENGITGMRAAASCRRDQTRTGNLVRHFDVIRPLLTFDGGEFWAESSIRTMAALTSDSSRRLIGHDLQYQI
jgi:hypothetical protein